MSRELRQIPREPMSREDVILVSPNDDLGFGPELADNRANRERRVAQMRLLWSHRLMLLKVLGYGLVISFAIAWLIPSRYESTSRLMPPDQSSGSGLASLLASFAGKSGDEAGGGVGGFAADALGVKTSGDLFIGVLQSRTVQDDLISKFNLRRVYWDRKWEDAREDLAGHTTLTNDKKTGIILIKISDHNPQRAAAMGREYIDQLNWVMTELNTSAAHRERVFLEGRLREVQQDLEKSETAFSQFASRSAALDVPAQGKAMVEATAALEGELIAAQTELQGLKQVYTDSNVRVRSTQARIDELQRQIQKMGGSTGAGEGDSESLYPSLRQLPLLGVTYADLLRRTKIQEAVFATLTQEYELAKVEEAKAIPSVKVLDPPNVPGKVSFPPRLLLIFSGGLFALLGGVAWVLAAHKWQQVDPRDPTKAFALEVVNDFRSHFIKPSANELGENEYEHKRLGVKNNDE